MIIDVFTNDWVGHCTGCGSAASLSSEIRCTMSSEVGMKRTVRMPTIDSDLPWLRCWHPKGTILEIDGERVE